MTARWRCASCGRDHPAAADRYVCDCPDRGRLDLVRDPGAAGGGVAAELPGMWRYLPLLPFAPDEPAVQRLARGFVPGGTPLVRSEALARRFRLRELWIKDESANPTGSLKDRASAAVVAAALSHRVPVVATASCGNAAVALAGAAAAAGLRCVVFVPERAAPDAVGHCAAFGAAVVRVAGEYEDSVRLALAACDAWGWYSRTTAVNPYTTQGKKTAGLEIAEATAGAPPDAVVVPVGDGNVLTGIHRGLADAVSLGWIPRLPRLVGVQAAGAAPVHRAWSTGADRVVPVRAGTVADGIRVGAPLDGDRALAAVRQSGGCLVTVSDAQIGAAADWLPQQGGVRTEPSAAATAAALPELAARGDLRPGERVVLVNTGAARTPAAPVPLPPPVADLAAVAGQLGDLARPLAAPRTTLRSAVAALPEGAATHG